MEALDLIDVTVEDDLLICSDDCLLDPPSPIDHSEEGTGDLDFKETNLKQMTEFPELSLSPIRTTVQFKSTENLHLEEINVQEEEYRLKVDDLSEDITEISLSPEQKRLRTDRNLRKSLAWDKAFFTCEGVLNTEELAIINPKPQNQPSLSQIPEDSSQKSAESTEDLNLSLESLESELFNNARTSLQKSLTEGNECLKGKKKVNLGASRFSPKEKVVMRAGQNKMRPPIVSGIRKPPKLPERSSSSISAPINPKLSIAESKANSLKPPRILPKSSNVSKTLIKGSAPLINNTLKRNSTGTVLNPQPNPNPKSTKIPSSSRSLIRPPTPNPNPNPNPPLKRNQSLLIPPPILNSPKPITKTNPSKTPSSSRCKIVKTPNQLLKQSSISPNSSIDSVDLMNGCNESPSSLTGRSLNKDNLSGGGLSRSSSNSSICSEDNNNSKRGFKPTGLRMPAPKKGYFDKEKMLGRNTVDKENVHLNINESVPAVQNLEEKLSSLSFSHI